MEPEFVFFFKFTVHIQWNYLVQTVALGCEGFQTFRILTPSISFGCDGSLVGCEGLPTFRELTASTSSSCAGGLVGCEGFGRCGNSPSPSSGCSCWRLGRSYYPKRRNTFMSWRGSQEKISLHSVAAASRLVVLLICLATLLVGGTGWRPVVSWVWKCIGRDTEGCGSGLIIRITSEFSLEWTG
jgi:hypothetical protein